MTSTAITRPLQAWQVMLGGICGLVLTIGLARFAYTPLLPALQAQTGLNDAAAGGLAAINYAGYIVGALVAAWMDDVRWRHRFYSAGLWMALLTTAAMALSSWLPAWGLWRFLGGLCGATGMLLGSGLVLGWLMRQGRRPELGVLFIGLGLGIVVSALGAWVLSDIWTLWSDQWLAFAALGLVFFVPAWLWRPPVPPVPTAAVSAQAQPQVSRRWMATLALSYFAAGWGFVISATFTVAIVEREPALAGQGALAKLDQPIRWGIGGPLAGGHFFMSWIHLDDLVRLFLWALENPHVSGPINATSPEPVRNGEMVRQIARRLKRPAFFPVPYFVLRLAVGEFARFLCASQRVLPNRALEGGFVFRYPSIASALDAEYPVV